MTVPCCHHGLASHTIGILWTVEAEKIKTLDKIVLFSRCQMKI